MRKAFFLLLIIFLHFSSFSQQFDSLRLKQLAIPVSPAFLLSDAAPTNIESPVNPKEFTLGLIQNFDADARWFNDYSMEFTPYWWVKPAKRSAYGFMGLKKEKGQNTYVQNYFSGLQFTSVSVAFLNKDMLPDSSKAKQKIFSVGARTTLLKIRSSSYQNELNNRLAQWTKLVQHELDILTVTLAFMDSSEADSVLKAFANEKSHLSNQVSDEIKNILEQKPIFNWDMAAAISQYGIGDSAWASGRTGVWTTLASYIPLEKRHQSYFDILLGARYMMDNYTKNDSGKIIASGILDIGGKAGIEIQRFALFAEGMTRKSSARGKWEKRITGMMSYRVLDNLLFTATYGKDFDSVNKIIALFGINWGFGSEKVNIPLTEIKN